MIPRKAGSSSFSLNALQEHKYLFPFNTTCLIARLFLHALYIGVVIGGYVIHGFSTIGFSGQQAITLFLQEVLGRCFSGPWICRHPGSHPPLFREVRIKFPLGLKNCRRGSVSREWEEGKGEWQAKSGDQFVPARKRNY